MGYAVGQTVKYDTGKGVVEARIFRVLARKLWLDHYTFSRARVVPRDSPRLVREG